MRYGTEAVVLGGPQYCSYSTIKKALRLTDKQTEAIVYGILLETINNSYPELVNDSKVVKCRELVEQMQRQDTAIGTLVEPSRLFKDAPVTLCERARQMNDE